MSRTREILGNHCILLFYYGRQIPVTRRGQDGVLSSLNVVIDDSDPAKELLNITAATIIFGVLLTMVQVVFILFRDEIFQVHIQLPPIVSSVAGLSREDNQTGWVK